MDFVTDSDPIVVFAFWLGVVVVLMTIIMLAVILIMRQVVLIKEKNHARAVKYWGKILTHDIYFIPMARYTLPVRDLSGFLEVWNAIHEPLHGQTKSELIELANQIELEKHLHAMLRRGGFHEHLIAIIALGHIKNKTSFERVENYIDDNSPLVSLCAARALMQIDPKKAVSLLVPQIEKRIDWSAARVATILQEAGAENVSKELSQATLRAHIDVAPRLIRFLGGVSPAEATPIIRKILASSQDEHMISTCLQVMTDAADLLYVRELLTHPRWHVRMQATVTLGRLGVLGDEQKLMNMLTDEQWWVRYRAAQGILSLPFMTRTLFESIRHQQNDQYARDALDHVLAEKTMRVS